MMHYSLYWIVQIHESNVDNLSTYKKLMTYIFGATPNALKSYTMSEIWVECSNQCQYTKKIATERLSITLLHHPLLLGAQSQQSLSAHKLPLGDKFLRTS